MSSIPVTITGAGSLIGQGIIKCLNKSNLDIDLHGLDYFNTAIGLRWCKTGNILPDILNQNISEDDWFNSLCEFINDTKSLLLFVGVDFELMPVAKRTIELYERTGCRAVIGSVEFIKFCVDKYETMNTLESMNIPVPKSFLPSEDLDMIENAIGYPMIVKPRFGSRSKFISRVNDLGSLREAIDKIERPLIQQYLMSDDNEFTCGVVILDGNIDSVCILRRTLKDGNTSFAVSERNTAIEEICKKVASESGTFGPLNIQLRLENNVPYIFEINPRFSGTTIFRSLLGVNEPLRILKHMLEMPLEPTPILELGNVFRYFEEFVEKV